MSGESPGRNGSLQAVGLSELEERLYRDLVHWDGGSASDVAGSAGISKRKAGELIASLEAKGLLSRSATRPVRYVPIPPTAAINILIHRRQEEFERVRIAAKELEAEAGRGEPAPADGVVEVVAPGEPATNRYDQLLMSAEGEILGLSAPPLEAPDQAFVDFKLRILGRGVRARVIYAPHALDIPGVVDFIERVHPAGEESRTLGEVPMQLLVVDHKVAMVPLQAQRPGAGHEFLVVHPSALLDALVVMFEALWEKAVPFSASLGRDGRAARDNNSPLSAEDRRLLALLASGMKDLAIAEQLGVKPRTVERRLARIMDLLGTQNRFQTAAEAARRGWLGGAEEPARDRTS